VEDEVEALLKRRTDAARKSAVAKHVGSMPARIQRWLADVLDTFVTENPVGTLCAYAYPSDEPALPSPLQSLEIEAEGFLIYAWPAVVSAMMKRIMEAEDGRVAPDVDGALNALEDRMAVFTYEPWKLDATNPKALVTRLDQIASAYSVGAAIAWAGITKNAPKDVQRLRRIVGTLEPHERSLLTQRYERRIPIDKLKAQLGMDGNELGYEIATILETIRARAPN
jgi:hypothetical protein